MLLNGVARIELVVGRQDFARCRLQLVDSGYSFHFGREMCVRITIGLDIASLPSAPLFMVNFTSHLRNMSVDTMKILFLTSLCIWMTMAIKVIKEEGSSVKEGETLSINCQVDVWYEWCTIKHNGNICDFEYKYSLGDVEVVNCTDYSDRYTFMGDYQQSECGITLINATSEDAGDWTCEFEEYNSGYTRNYGKKIEGKVNVSVELRPATTTTTTTTTSTTARTAITTTTAPVTIAPPVTIQGDVTTMEDHQHTHPKALHGLINNMTRDKNEAAEGEAMSAKAIDDKDVDAASVTTPVVVALCLLILVGGLAVVYGLHYKRRLHPMFYSVLTGNRFKPMNNDLLNSTNIIKNENIDTELEAIEGIPAAKILNAAKVTCGVEDDGQEEKKDKEKEVNKKESDVKGISGSMEDLKLGVLHSDL